MELAVRYRKPVIAYFGDHQVDWVAPPGVPSARALADVEHFVRETLAHRGPAASTT
jgi:hypothetical protein